MESALVEVAAVRHDPPFRHALTDVLAVEEPLELRLTRTHPGDPLPIDALPLDALPLDALPLGVLMRTPGHDRELLVGWLLSEGLLPAHFDLVPDPENPNVWSVTTPEVERLSAGARLGVSSSACGVCGSGSIERLTLRAAAPTWGAGPVQAALISRLPAALLQTQTGFQASGGLHAAGLCTPAGDLLHAFEDVGRHNAVDKVLGWAHLRGALGQDLILVVSSRAGFEIVQKAVSAGVAVVVTVGAASSLAVETAQTFGVTLCAFVRDGRMTVYSGANRLV